MTPTFVSITVLLAGFTGCGIFSGDRAGENLLEIELVAFAIGHVIRTTYRRDEILSSPLSPLVSSDRNLRFPRTFCISFERIRRFAIKARDVVGRVCVEHADREREIPAARF